MAITSSVTDSPILILFEKDRTTELWLSVCPNSLDRELSDSLFIEWLVPLISRGGLLVWYKFVSYQIVDDVFLTIRACLYKVNSTMRLTTNHSAARHDCAT